MFKRLAAHATLLTYIAGAAAVSFGVALVFLPAGVIAAGLFLIALVVVP